MGTIFVDNLEPQSGTSLTLGASGDTVSLGSGGTVTNTPAFMSRMSGDQSISANTATKVDFDTEFFDTDSAFDISNQRFTVPSGKAGKDFVAEMVFWIRQFNCNSKLNGVALRILMILPTLLLQN